ncbi:MAG: hypothetical protein GF307_08755 [candidate division Zixibacteria bacterium]|nr:hypothetical protein [candidate division Zixibacteria bacterium]
MRYILYFTLIYIALTSVAESAVIDEVKIIRKDVFDSELKEHNYFFYKWGNALHIRTRDWVIRDQLLYETGDDVDTLKILETERNLRSLDFIGDVETELEYNGDSSEVDVILTTNDQWSTILGLTSEASGGDYTYGGVLEEVNLLGWGKNLQAEYYSGNDRRGHYLSYYDYNFFRSRFRANLLWENDGFVRNTSYSLSKPFYSLVDKYSYGFSGFDSRGKIRYYYSGSELFRYESERRSYKLYLTRSYGKNFKRNFSVIAYYSEEEYSADPRFSRYSSLIPVDETEGRLSVGAHVGLYKYKTTRLLDNFGNVEDLTLGWWISAEVGRALDIFDTNVERTYGEVSLKTAFNYPENLYVSASVKLKSRFDNGYEHASYGPLVKLYYRHPFRMVTALRAMGVWYDRPDPYLINYISGKNGLRGFETYDLSGQNYVVMNIEHRYYSPFKLLTVAFGAAVFYDVGKAWYEFAGYDSSEWEADYGFGLRFGLTKSSAFKVVRVDIAKSTSEDEFYLSFGTQMYFTFGS